MAVPTQILDGGPPHGTTSVTTITGAVTYIVNTETVTPTWDEALNRTATGTPNQGLWVKGRYSYSGEWQLASTGTLPPTSGDTFTRTVENESSSVTFVILSVTTPKTNEVNIRTTTVEAKSTVGTITTA